MRRLERHILLALDRGAAESDLLKRNSATLSLLITGGLIQVGKNGGLALTQKGSAAFSAEIARKPIRMSETLEIGPRGGPAPLG